MRKILILIGAVLMAFPASAEPELHVKLEMKQIHEATDLGSVEVAGLGEVSLVAQRKGSVIVLTATGPDKVPIGRSETTVGLAQSPIFIRTEDGLTKISVIWNSPD